MKSIDSVIKVLKNGFISQKEIQAITNLSQPTVSKCLSKLGHTLLKLPHSSPQKYALAESIFDSDKPFGLAEVDEHGKESFLGNVNAISGGKYFVSLQPGVSKLYLGIKGNGLFDGLPYFLDDLRPQGFLGVQLAKQLTKISKDYPSVLSQWSAKNILQYLIEYGDDLPGNLKFGEGVFKSLRQPVAPVSTDSYDFMCQQIKEGSVPNSSAGGEQQKFTAFNKEVNAHVLVKYTSNENDAVTRRWKDVLVTEFHALKVLAEFGIPAAEVRLLDQDNRYYLETKRFDRPGNYGRSSMISLLSIDMEFTGMGENWQYIAKALFQQNMSTPTDNYCICFLWHFSKLIGNTDTHLGNISFGIKGETFSLLPIYDMCTMAIAPKLNSLDPIALALPNSDTLNEVTDSKELIINAAINFWQMVKDDARISDEFRNYLTLHNPVMVLKTLL